jgi:hypothetical protein
MLNFNSRHEEYVKLTGDETANGIIRKGKIGGYRDEMCEEYVKKFDIWMAESNDLKQGYVK